MEQVDLTKQEARRIAIQAQRLSGPRPPATAEGLMDVAHSIRVIQIDSVAVAGAPTQYLVPFSRLGPYDRTLLDRLAFQDRRLFHYLAHAASLVLTQDFPIFAAMMRPFSKRTDAHGIRVATWMAANANLRRQVLDAMRRRGPLRSRDIEDTATDSWHSTGWTGGRNVNQMLERLWREGEITVVGRDGNQRLWDLSKRWFPAWTPREKLSAATRSDRAVSFAMRALGVATERHVYVHFTRSIYHDLKGSLSRLVNRGEILPATVGGRRGYFVHRDYVADGTSKWRGRTVLLSPFDNLIADRQRTKQLFDFDYTIEIYVPPAKRRRGYYAMPILSDDRLIGSADVKFDRDSKKLVVQKLVFEDGFDLTPAVERAIGELETFARRDPKG